MFSLLSNFDLQLVESYGTHRYGFTCTTSSAIWEEHCPFQLLLTLLTSFSLLLSSSMKLSLLFWFRAFTILYFDLLHVFSSASCIYFVYSYIGSLFENMKYINSKHPIEELNICSYLFKITYCSYWQLRSVLGPQRRIYSSEVKILKKTSKKLNLVTLNICMFTNLLLNPNWLPVL